MQSLLYISRRQSQPGEGGRDVDAIVTVSRPRNAALELTGALVATPLHFAQILEGPAHAIDEVMTSIRRDHRHHDILAAPMQPIPRREFHRWTLAYHGESTYVSDMVAATLESSAFEIAKHAQNVRNLMAMLA